MNAPDLQRLLVPRTVALIGSGAWTDAVAAGADAGLLGRGLARASDATITDECGTFARSTSCRRVPTLHSSRHPTMRCRHRDSARPSWCGRLCLLQLRFCGNRHAHRAANSRRSSSTAPARCRSSVRTATAWSISSIGSRCGPTRSSAVARARLALISQSGTIALDVDVQRPTRCRSDTCSPSATRRASPPKT